MPISKSTSIYLNLVRWVSATAVVLYHLRVGNFGPSWLIQYFPSNGHGFVTIFFVVSGFVISMAAEQKTALQFTIDRSARIYIVAIPALLISLILSIFFADLAHDDQAVNSPLSTLFLNATFLSQSWSVTRYPFQNAPYWSLSYEVMYYLAFGCFVYAKGPLRWTLITLVCFLAGPKILALFPCWLMGVAAYKLRNFANATPTAGLVVAFGTPIFLAICVSLGLKNVLNELSDRVAFQATTSEAFIKSWLLAAAFAIHLWGICQIKIAFPKFIETISSKLAAMSYSLYLVHFPIIFTIAILIGNTSTIGFLSIMLIAVFAGCYFFSRLTEANTKRLRTVIERIFIRHLGSPNAIDARSSERVV
jgi:peptidoglycan/LPS O-acetylase OafA/YrhL